MALTVGLAGALAGCAPTFTDGDPSDPVNGGRGPDADPGDPPSQPSRGSARGGNLMAPPPPAAAPGPRGDWHYGSRAAVDVDFDDDPDDDAPFI